MPLLEFLRFLKASMGAARLVKEWPAADLVKLKIKVLKPQWRMAEQN